MDAKGENVHDNIQTLDSRLEFLSQPLFQIHNACLDVNLQIRWNGGQIGVGSMKDYELDLAFVVRLE